MRPLSILLLLLCSLSFSFAAKIPQSLREQIEVQNKAAGGQSELEPLLLWNEANTKSIILLHGLYEPPQSMITLAHSYASQGYNVYVPQLPGHGLHLEGIENIAVDSYAKYIDSEVNSFAQSGQKLSLAGFSINGLALGDFVVRNQKAWPSHVERVDIISANFGDSSDITDRKNFYARGAEVKLLRRHSESNKEARERSPQISARNLAAIDNMRASVNGAQRITIPNGVVVNVFINPGDNVSDTNMESSFFHRLEGDKALHFLEVGNKHISVPSSATLLKLIQQSALGHASEEKCHQRLRSHEPAT